MRQPREQARPVPGHLGQEPGLAPPAQQVPDQRDGQQLGVGAYRRRARPGRDSHSPGADRVIDQHVHIDEQILGWQHGRWPLQDNGFDTHLSLAEATSRQGRTGSTHITRLILQRQLGECIAAPPVVAEPGLVLASPSPV
jgi:hypothetical protein